MHTSDPMRLIPLMLSLFWISPLAAIENPDIVLNIEEPQDGTVYQGVANLRGWAVAPIGLTRIEAYLDGEYLFEIPLGGTRGDVGDHPVYGQYPDAIHSGFSMALNYGNYPVGQHELLIRAVDVNDGHLERSVRFGVVSFPNPYIVHTSEIPIVHLDPDTTRFTATSPSEFKIAGIAIDGKTYDLYLHWRDPRQGFTMSAIREIGALNIPPEALEDHAVTDAGTAVRIAVMTNDYDPDQGPEPLRINYAGQPDNGTLTWTEGETSLLYTPNPGFAGVDAFYYGITDGVDFTDGLVKVTVEDNSLIFGRYRPIGDQSEIILDTVTGLEWQRCSIGQSWNPDMLSCDGEAMTFTWEDTSGWTTPDGFRVPVIDELRTLVYCSTGIPVLIDMTYDYVTCGGEYQLPTIVLEAFPNTPIGWFWSSSPSAEDDYSAWHIHFDEGVVDYYLKEIPNYVRLVRNASL